MEVVEEEAIEVVFVVVVGFEVVVGLLLVFDVLLGVVRVRVVVLVTPRTELRM